MSERVKAKAFSIDHDEIVSTATPLVKEVSKEPKSAKLKGQPSSGDGRSMDEASSNTGVPADKIHFLLQQQKVMMLR